MRYYKQITPIGNGNVLGELFDGEVLIHDKEYSTYTQAERALDALILATGSGEGVTSTHLPDWNAECPCGQPALYFVQRPHHTYAYCPECYQDMDYAPVYCKSCNGPHYTYQCPAIRALLFDAPVGWES